MNEYKENIADKLKSLDVGIVVLNAGSSQTGPFADLHNSEVEQVVQTNANHVAYTAKAILPQLVERFKKKKVKCVLMITSSVKSLTPMAG